MRPMHPHLIAVAALLMPSLLFAQSAASPIRHSLYVALGGDPGSLGAAESSPFAVSAGVERAHVGSRWSLRLGADYRRLTSRYSETRWEDYGVALTARYGRRSGTLRPYLLGGVGVADLRTRGRWTKYDDVGRTLYGPVDSGFTSASRWNGSITSGLGTDFALGRLRLFAEVKLNLYPARLSDRARARSMESTKALYFGIKF
jgi:opacity protein-like surface antigen